MIRRIDDFGEFLRLIRVDNYRQPLVCSGIGVRSIDECCRKWRDIEYLKAACARDQIVSVHVMNDGEEERCHGRLEWAGGKNFTYVTMPVGEFLDNIVSNKKQMYLRSIGKNIRKDASNLDETFPQIASEFKLYDLFSGVVTRDNMFSSVLRMGSRNLSVWTHYDGIQPPVLVCFFIPDSMLLCVRACVCVCVEVMDNLLFQAVGSKHVTVFPPTDAERLYTVDSSSLVHGLILGSVSLFACGLTSTCSFACQRHRPPGPRTVPSVCGCHPHDRHACGGRCDFHSCPVVPQHPQRDRLPLRQHQHILQESRRLLLPQEGN